MLSVVMLNGIMLSVVAPRRDLLGHHVDGDERAVPVFALARRRRKTLRDHGPML